MRVTLGQINGLYGIQGWVKVFSYTAPKTNILNYSSWQLYYQDSWHVHTMCAGQAQGKGLIAQLSGCQTRDQAAQLLGAEIAIDRQQLPTLNAEEYYWTDLIGLQVINQDDIHLGQVAHLFATGANDVLVLSGERERLIPFLLDSVILEIDLTQRRLRVDWDAHF